MHSLSASLKLSTAVAAAGVVIALVTLRGEPAPSRPAGARRSARHEPDRAPLGTIRPPDGSAPLTPEPGHRRYTTWHRQT